MKIFKFILLNSLVLALISCTSATKIHENKNSVTYQHRDDKFSTLSNPNPFITSAASEALKECQKKGYQSVRLGSSQCVEYCSKNYECVCISNFICK